jgi:hypothetical protein
MVIRNLGIGYADCFEIRMPGVVRWRWSTVWAGTTWSYRIFFRPTRPRSCHSPRQASCWSMRGTEPASGAVMGLQRFSISKAFLHAVSAHGWNLYVHDLRWSGLMGSTECMNNLKLRSVHRKSERFSQVLFLWNLFPWLRSLWRNCPHRFHRKVLLPCTFYRKINIQRDLIFWQKPEA